ncbi:hypothetical protein WR25_06811 [Diploscapter pachys]|uniref:F-box domain-containing protein n=1 Tax=Diploscapter pachys TaxID=2018661 RepID=A0A2A2LNP3_9BILA|nr:hypothetical protein WR25_06811 [Diploscapter pachys]
MLDDIPAEMLLEVFVYLPMKDLVEAAKINRRIHAVASNKHNASGKRLAKQNRVTVYVNIYDGADSDNPGHEMSFTKFMYVAIANPAKPEEIFPSLRINIPCCRKHTIPTGTEKDELHKKWPPMTMKRIFEVTDQEEMEEKKKSIAAIKTDDEYYTDEEENSAIVRDQGFWTLEEAFECVKLAIYYIYLDFGYVVDLTLAGVTKRAWSLIKDFFEEHPCLIRSRTSMYIREYPEDCGEFFTSPYFRNGIDTLSIWDQNNYDQADQPNDPHYEFCQNQIVRSNFCESKKDYVEKCRYCFVLEEKVDFEKVIQCLTSSATFEKKTDREIIITNRHQQRFCITSYDYSGEQSNFFAIKSSSKHPEESLGESNE